jgi:radical SAM protein with 4Fe4S-binding SPASM domain
MCNIWQMKTGKEMIYKDWEKVGNDPVFEKVETLTISGGEGMLYPQYVKTVEMWIGKLSKLKKLILNTNGFLSGDIAEKVGKVAKICREKSIRLEVCVSMDGLEKRHNEVRRVKDGFKKVLKTVDYLKEMKKKRWLDFLMASVLMKNNLSDYWELKEWYAQQGLNYCFQLIGFHDTYVNNRQSQEDLDFEKSQEKELLKIIEDIQKNQKGVGMAGYYWADMMKYYQGRRRQTPCPFLLDEVVVDSLGDVYYCLSTKGIGNILKEKKSAREIYFDPKNIKYRKMMWENECRRCNSGCDVVRAIAGEMWKFVGYKLAGWG